MRAVRVQEHQNTLGKKGGRFEKGKSTQLELVNS